MRVSPICCCLLLATAVHGGPIVLLADDPAYKAAKGSETVFEGVLERTPSKGMIGGTSRFNPYRLNGKDGVHDLYVGDRAPRLVDYVGQKVRITGKLVEIDADGAKRVELWPGRVESLGEAVVEKPPMPKPMPPEDGVLARCTWQPAAAMTLKGGRYVFRDAAMLAREMKVTGTDPAPAATATMAKLLRVPTIDWDKQMLVTISAGLRGTGADRMTVTKIERDGMKLTIRYRLTATDPGTAAIGYPAETVLIDRFDGNNINFVEDKAPPTPNK